MFLHPSFCHWAFIQQRTKTTLLIIHLTLAKTIRVVLSSGLQWATCVFTPPEYEAVLSECLYCLCLSVSGGSGGFRGLSFSALACSTTPKLQSPLCPLHPFIPGLLSWDTGQDHATVTEPHVCLLFHSAVLFWSVRGCYTCFHPTIITLLLWHLNTRWKEFGS